ncbi:MAG: RsmE family RNA methyltransferase [Deltaproteobacteria bacterium]
MPRRFFITPETINADTATLEGPEAHHVLNVLRLKKGALIELFDGTGNLYQAEITATGRGKISLTIVSTASIPRKRPELHLAPALLKGKKLEIVLQKAVELGVTGLYPFYSIHSDRQPAKNNKGNTPGDRWQRIVLEACKQCGQTILPDLSEPVSFPELLRKTSQYSHTLLCYEREKTQKIGDISVLLGSAKAILLITGPEGGFSENEIASARQHQCTTVSLGPLTLRAETAALVAMAIVQHHLGTLG